MNVNDKSIRTSHAGNAEARNMYWASRNLDAARAASLARTRPCWVKHGDWASAFQAVLG